ncbi:MAG: DUF389 domain-containing protein [Saprospiraceae bacterium]|nr:DUF389 domain-containing protein [Saprospiraceae bacterium]MBK8282819.1 DUF389 domain-containing protein [Saprospiraceae bacterium]
MNIKIINRLSLLKEREDFAVVQVNIKKNSLAEGTNLWILFFAILIACLGLNINSSAVVIGAMLISPLIGPIVGIGFGVAINDLKLLKTAFTSYIFATTVGLIASTIYFLISPMHAAHSEILARTTPSIYDVMIASFGGFAGIIAMTSKQKGNVIPGVAIATALMPPLCTAGYGLATAQFNYFLGAFYLYIINSVFIFAATIVITNLMKFPSKKYDDPKLEIKEKRITWIIIFLTLVPSIYLGYNLIQKLRFTEKAEKFITAEAIFKNDYLLKKEINPGRKSMILTYGGREISKEEKDNVRKKLKYYDLDSISLQINNGFYFENDDKNLVQLNQTTEQLSQIGVALNQSAAENQALRSTLDSIQHQYDLGAKLYKELKILYPDLGEAVIQPATILQDTVDARQVVYLVALTLNKDPGKTERDKLESWLKTRIGDERFALQIYIKPQ